MNLERIIKLHAKVLLETSTLPMSFISRITKLSGPTLWSIRRMTAGVAACVALMDALVHAPGISYKRNPTPFQDSDRAKAAESLLGGKILCPEIVKMLGWGDTVAAYEELRTIEGNAGDVTILNPPKPIHVTRRKLKGVKP